MMTQTRPDNAGVIAPPPLISLAALFIGLGLDWLAPIGLLETALPRTARVSLAVLIGAVAIWSAARGIMGTASMRRPSAPQRSNHHITSLVVARATSGFVQSRSGR